MRPTFTRVLLVLTCLPLTATAQPGDAKPLDDRSAEENPLRGPKLVAAGASTKPTIVARTFEGKLEQLDTRPEFAAIEVMTFDDATRAKLDALRTTRTAEIDAALKANLPLFLEIQGANQAGDRAGAMPLIRKLREAAPEIFDPPLTDRFVALLSPQDAATFRGIVDEYNQALAKERAGDQKGDQMGGRGEPRPRPGIDARRTETMQTIRELARALGSTVAERRERLDGALQAIDASPELGEKIRSIIRESAAQAPAGQLSSEQRAATTRRIFELLTPDQRRLWIQHLRDGR